MKTQVFPSGGRILIGPITQDPTESVGKVNEAFAKGLRDTFRFDLHQATRTMGRSRQGGANVLNAAYFIKHLATWIYALCRGKPEIAHYGLTSQWNLEKCITLLWLAERFGAKTIAHLHGGGFIEFWSSLPAKRKRRAAKILNRLDGFVTLSEGWRRSVIREIGLPPERVHVVHNPLDSDFEERVPDFPAGRSGFNVLCFGVMDSKKGVLDIVDAAARLIPCSDAVFQLVGPEREPGIVAEVNSRIRLLGLEGRVLILGAAVGSDKIRLFRDAAMLLLPSYIENFPVSIVEAAASGVPIITTRVGATPEFFEHESSALFVEEGHVDQIASAVNRLLNDRELGKRLAANARDVFNRSLSRDKVMAQMETVYHSVLRGASRRKGTR